MNKKKIKQVESLLSEAKQSLNDVVSNEEELESSVCREKYLKEFENVCNKFDVNVELEEDDRGKDEVYSEWNDTVNVSASELQKWSRNPCSRQASKDPEAVIKRNLRLLDKNKEDWTSNDVEDAKRTISFVNRMNSEEMRPDSPREGPHGCPSEWAISLLNWAYNPFDSIPTPDEQVQEKLDPVEQVDLSEMMRDSGPQGYEFEPIPDQVLYSERSDAMERAKDLGLEGVHEHEFGPENVVMYMPGSEHRDWVERVKGLPDEEKLEEDFSFEEDDQVTWESSGGQAYGVVRDRTNDECYDASIDGDVKVCGEEDSPAYLIEVWNDEKDQLTGTMVAHKEDTLTKTTFKDDTAEMSEERDASQVFHSKQQERSKNDEEDDEGSVSVPPVAIHKVEGGETHEVSDDVEKVLDELWNEE